MVMRPPNQTANNSAVYADSNGRVGMRNSAAFNAEVTKA